MRCSFDWQWQLYKCYCVFLHPANPRITLQGNEPKLTEINQHTMQLTYGEFVQHI